MKKRERRRQIKTRLERYKPELTDNIIPLYESDFGSNDKLLACGYSRLKDLTEHLNRDMKLTITMPEKYIEDFKGQLDRFVTLEIISIEKEIKNNRIKAYMMFIISITIAVIYSMISDTFWFYDMSIVAFYVFTWGAIDRVVFWIPKLREEEDWLLQLANSEIEASHE